MAKGGQSGKGGSSPGQEALRLLETGDVWKARLLARRVLSAAPKATDDDATVPPDVAAAQEVLSRTSFPRDTLKVAALAATLIVLLVILAAARG